MVERNGVTEHVYVYDDNGNRIEHTGPDGVLTVADYDEQDRLLQYGDITYTRTQAGERQTRTDSDGTTQYDYDAATNLREVTLPDGTIIEYLIDGRDRRVGKKIDGELLKTWIYRDQLSPVAQFDGEGNLTHRFVYAEKAHSPSWMVRIDPVTQDEAIYRIVADHLGSVRLVIEAETGMIAQRMDYGPFGEVLFDSNPGFQPFGFAGGVYDHDTGLVRFGARDYDPEIGRWTAKDPIDFGGGDSSLYRYSDGDPVNRFDLAGYEGIRVTRRGILGEVLMPAHLAPFAKESSVAEAGAMQAEMRRGNAELSATSAAIGSAAILSWKAGSLAVCRWGWSGVAERADLVLEVVQALSPEVSQPSWTELDSIMRLEQQEVVERATDMSDADQEDRNSRRSFRSRRLP